uniref:Nuclear mitotic apparatus protein 1 n=1 Tax=Oncorhynchus mykiss TaxID=8022 RepID=A0A8K9V5G5_ONCMY
SMLRFVLDNENSLYLSENLEKYLRKKRKPSLTCFRLRSTVHLMVAVQKHAYSFSLSPVYSPLQDVMNTPQFQLKKLQRQLRQERDMRDELEKDLTTSAATLTQRESQICQLQHRIEKLLREQAEQEQEPRDELQELHSKNEGLRTRLHEVLKECQALKTNSSQMERKVDNLTEENGTLSAQECLNEQMLILQSKISSLEDELSKAKMQEKGEVMGPILEWEQLKQELADATLRHAECECTIARLKGEKEQAATLHAQERASLQAESQRLQVLVTELQEALSALRADREALELASKEERESLTAQLHTLTAEVASLTQTVQQREQEVKALGEEVQQECIQRGELNLAMERQERKLAAQENEINNMRERLAGLMDQISLLKELCQEGKNMEALREEHTAQLEQLRIVKEQVEEVRERNEETSAALREKESSLREKEESLRRLEEELQSTTSLASQRRQEELTSLKEEVISQQEEVERRRAAEALSVEEARQLAGEQESKRMELEESVSALQQQLDSAIQDNDRKRQEYERLEQDLEHRGTLVEELRQQEDSARLEATRLRQEISTHVSHLEVVQRGKEELARQQEELRGEVSLHQQRASVLQQSLEVQEVAMRVLKEQTESTREEATVKMEALQAQLEVVSSLAAAKDLQLSTLREKATTLQEQLAKREQEISLQKEVLQEAHMEKESVEVLREELARQQEELREELIRQQQRAQSLEQSLEEQQEALKELTVKEERAREEATLKMVALQAAKDLELSTLRQEATQLRQEISTHVSRLEEVQRGKEEQEGNSREETTVKMEALQAQLEVVLSLAAAKDLQLNTLREEASVLCQENAKRAADLKDVQSEKIRMESMLSEEHRALQEELAKEQEELRGEVLQEAQAAALQEEAVDALRGEVTLHQQRAAELQQSLEHQEAALREQEAKSTEEATLKMEALQAAKDLQLSTLTEKATTLQQQLAKREQEISLQKEVLQEAHMEKESVEVLREELARQQEELREELIRQQQRAQSLEQSLEEQQEALKELTVKEERAREEATLKMVALQAAKDLEISTLRQEATQLRQEISTHVSRLEEVQRGKEELREQEGNAREETTVKMEALQAQLEVVSSLAAAKDLQLSTLREEATTLQEQLAKREQEISLQKEVLQEAHMEKESVEVLREELARQQEELRELTVKEERAREEATLKMVALQAAKDLELSTLRQEATQLRQEISTYVSRLEEVQSEGPLREEHTALQVQLAKQQEENSLQKGLLQEVQATVLQEREAKETLRGEVSLHQQSLEHQEAVLREDLARQKEEGQAAGQVEKELMEQFSVLQQEKEALLTRALQAEQNQSELEGSMAELRAQAESTESGQRQQLDALLLEKERLTEGNQVLEIKCSAAQRLEAVLQEELALLREQMEGTEWEKQVRDLRKQLAANTEVVEHYKTQVSLTTNTHLTLAVDRIIPVEKAKSHYSGKKQQLVESQEQVTELQRSLEVREHEVNAVTTEMKLLQKELEKARSKEKSLGSKINTLEAQVYLSIRLYYALYHTGCQLHVDMKLTLFVWFFFYSLRLVILSRTGTTSLTATIKKFIRVILSRTGTTSLTATIKKFIRVILPRTSTERRLESSITSLGELALDSARKRPPTSSARRRRTTQVINITMSKVEGALGHLSLHVFSLSLSLSHILSLVLSLPDQLLSLPGYRLCTTVCLCSARCVGTGQFCVGAENEPEHAADDWLRIAELQARNQSCLPHLKSSYPLESRPSLGPSFEFTDDDLRMGDPTETIRRASVMPGQIQESLSSHRLSLHPGPADSTTATSCFPRPLTPKGGRFSSSNNRQPKISTHPLFQAERRQSMVFSIDNTPRKAASKSGFLQRGMSKIRSSTRKSPGNKSSRVPRSGDGKSPRSGAGSVKSPQPAGKAQRKSPRTNSSKSPKNPTSARKVRTTSFLWTSVV